MKKLARSFALLLSIIMLLSNTMVFASNPETILVTKNFRVSSTLPKGSTVEASEKESSPETEKTSEEKKNSKKEAESEKEEKSKKEEKPHKEESDSKKEEESHKEESDSKKEEESHKEESDSKKEEESHKEESDSKKDEESHKEESDSKKEEESHKEESDSKKDEEPQKEEADSKKDEESHKEETDSKKDEEPQKEETESKKEEEPQKEETESKKDEEPQKEETDSKKDEEPQKEETDSKKDEEPQKEETDSKKDEEPQKEETDSKKEEEPQKEETDSKKDEEPQKEETIPQTDAEPQKDETIPQTDAEPQKDETIPQTDAEPQKEETIAEDAKAAEAEEFLLRVVIDADNSYTEMHKEGETVKLSVPTKEHYNFDGWEVESDEEINISNNKFTMPSCGVTLRAKWDPVNYTVAIYYLSNTGKNLHSANFSEVSYGTEFSLKSDYELPEVKGYELNRIKRDSDNEETTDFSNYRDFMKISSIEKDEAFYVYYNPTYVDYTVYHFIQKVDGSYSDEADEVENLSEILGEKVYAKDCAKTYSTYTFDSDKSENDITISASEEDNVLRIYYSRNKYDLYFQSSEDDFDQLSVYYEGTVNIDSLSKPVRSGYRFAGWQTADGTPVTGNFIMPAHDVVLNAKWELGTSPYVVRFWGETVASANNWTSKAAATNSASNYSPEYELLGDTILEAEVGATISSNEARNATKPSGLDSDVYQWESAYNPEYSVTVEADGSTVVNVYYTRKVCAYRFYYYRDAGFWDSGWTNYSWGNFNGYLYYKYGSDITSYWPNDYLWRRGSSTSTTYQSASTHAQDTSSPSNPTKLYRADAGSYTIYIKGDYETIDGNYEENYETLQTLHAPYSNTAWQGNAGSIPTGFEIDKIYSNYQRKWIDFVNGTRYESYEKVNDSYLLRLKRQINTITFRNDSSVTKIDVKYQAPISGAINGIEFTATDDRTFAGFRDENLVVYEGQTPEEAYAKYVSENGDSMPAYNISLTAIWEEPYYTVRFYKDDSLTEALTEAETVQRGAVVTNVPENPTSEDKEFAGWFYKDGDVEKLYWAEKAITSDTDIYAKWIVSDEEIQADIEVKHNFLKEDGSLDHTNTETITGIVGRETLVEAQEVEGYYPDFVNKNIFVNNTGNVVEFNYTPLDSVQYTIRYVNADGQDLRPSVTKDSTGMVVTENAVYIYKCTPRVFSQTLKLTSDPNQNIITFVYDVDGTTTYTINHYFQELDGSYTLDSETTIVSEEVQNYTQVTVEPDEYEGYEFNSDKSTTTGWAMPRGTSFNLYYDRLSYTVEYRYTEGIEVPEGAPTLPETPKTYVWGSEVTVAEVPEAPTGFKFVGWTFSEDSSGAEGTFEMPQKNVIIEGYFEKLQYYIVVDWDYEDGEYHGGSYTWDWRNLKYDHDATTAGWTKEPHVKCTVHNEGGEPVNLEFKSTANLWEQFLATNPFAESSTKRLEPGESYTFEFENFDWNYETLNEEAFKVALGKAASSPDEFNNSFELNITEAK